MAIMNDRSQAGSAYKTGRIELLINRYGITTDELGIWEPMKDFTTDGKGPNVTAKFWIFFTNSRTDLYQKILERHTLNMNKPMIYYTTSFQIVINDSKREDSGIKTPAQI